MEDTLFSLKNHMEYASTYQSAIIILKWSKNNKT